MNPALQQIAKCLVNQAVPGQRRLAGESGRDDQQTVMPATASRACVARVPGRVVDQFQANWREQRQALANDCFDIGNIPGDWRFTHAGSTFLNGLTVTFSYT